MINEKKYVDNGGSKCVDTNCDSSNISTSGNVQIDSGCAWQSVYCEDCGIEWTDEYKLVSVGNVFNNDGEELEID